MRVNISGDFIAMRTRCLCVLPQLFVDGVLAHFPTMSGVP
jgi:hypothetical protein